MTSIHTLTYNLSAALKVLREMRASTDADELRARWNARAEQRNKEQPQ